MRHQMRPLRFYIAECRAVISGQLDARLRIWNEGMPVRLFQGKLAQTGFTLEPQTAQPFRTGFSALDSSPTVSSSVVTPAGGACFCQWSYGSVRERRKGHSET